MAKRRENPIKRFVKWIGATTVGTWRQMRSTDVQLLAGSLAFTTVITLVPLLAVSLSVFNFFDGFESLIKKIEPFILQNFVEVSGAEISRYIRRAIKRVHSGALGIGGVIGLFIASTKLFHDMETAVQRVWHVKSNRNIMKRLVVYWLVMFVGPLVLASALGLIGSRDLGLIEVVPKASIALAFAFVAFVSIYKLVPACYVSWRSTVLSAALATTAVGLAQAFYGSITKYILSYSKLYGSLASIPIFLIWILVLWWICLAGVALCATLEKQRGPSIKSSESEEKDVTGNLS